MNNINMKLSSFSYITRLSRFVVIYTLTIFISSVLSFVYAFAEEVTSNDVAVEQNTTTSALGNLSLLLMIALIFYFLIFRPQQKKVKEHRNLLSSIKKGDAVITIAGIHGMVGKVEEGIVSVEISDGVVVKMQKDAIASIVRQSTKSDHIDDKESQIKSLGKVIANKKKINNKE